MKDLHSIRTQNAEAEQREYDQAFSRLNQLESILGLPRTVAPLAFNTLRQRIQRLQAQADARQNDPAAYVQKTPITWGDWNRNH